MFQRKASIKGEGVDLAGRKFDRLEALWPCCRITKSTHGGVIYQWSCLCDCGRTVVRSRAGLLYGKAVSCGCKNRDVRIKHGFTVRQKEVSAPHVYRAWSGMKSRCLNPQGRAWAYYGGRGIAISEAWINDFEQFYQDMGDPPTPSHSLDRIDVNKGYGPDNCRWATRKDQANNRRNNRRIEWRGEVKSMSQWAESLNIPRERLRYRLDSGLTMEQAMQKEIKCKGIELR